MRFFRSIFPWAFPLTLFAVVFFLFLNATYPLLGSDYSQFTANLLAGKWHAVRQGIQPFYHSPHFCGGIVRYGHPQDMFYSLTQFLVFVLDPWIAMQFGILASMLIGYFGWYRFGRDVASLDSLWPHVLSLTVISNGFLVWHIVLGHITFQAFTLIGCFLWLIFDRRPKQECMLLRRAALFALLSAYCLYSGGFYAVMFTAITGALLLPYDLIASGSEWKHRVCTLCIRVGLCVTAALLVCASKLVAVWSFMRFFPRAGSLFQFDPSINTITHILGSLFVVPQKFSTIKPVNSPADMLFHEFTMAHSYAVIVGMLCGLWLLCTHRGLLLKQAKRSTAALVYCVFLVALMIQMVRGYGFLIDPLDGLPLLQSMRFSTRFLYIFVILLTIPCIWSIERVVMRSRFKERSTLFAQAALLCTVLFFIAANGPAVYFGPHANTFPYNRVLEYAVADPAYLEKPVTRVVDTHPIDERDIVHIFNGTTGHCYETIYDSGSLHTISALSVNPVTHVDQDSYLNMINPACLQYPEANGCEPGDRIRVEDRENLDRFSRGQKTTWVIPWWQQLVNWISIASLIVAGVITIQPRKPTKKNRKTS